MIYMNNIKNFSEWRAEKLGYVYFSRLNNLIIKEEPGNALFDLLIDIKDRNGKDTGRFFGVEVKSTKNIPVEKYKNITIPALLVFFDKKTDNGSYKWIKKPVAEGELSLDNKVNDFETLNTESLNKIVKEITDWYSQKSNNTK
jgi:hypothetical protein